MEPDRTSPLQRDQPQLVGLPAGAFELILNYIAATITCTGLVVTSCLNRNEYPTGIQISDEKMEAIDITPNEHIRKWNYTVSPCPNR